MFQPQARAEFQGLSGLIVAIFVAAGSWLVVTLLAALPGWLGRLPLSSMLMAVLIGLALAPVARHKLHWRAGLDLARDPLLKLAVALIGLRLSLPELLRLGGKAAPLVVLIVVCGLLLTTWLTRQAGAGRRLSLLLATGTSICGASAIAALAPGLQARREETCYAVACIAFLGLAATLLYPWLLHKLLGHPESIGLVLGVAVHDTAQVTAAASLYEQAWQADGTLNSATVAKLLRNSSMLLVLPLILFFHRRHHAVAAAGFPLPLFVIAFILLSAARSAGDAWLGAEHALWRGLIELGGEVSVFLFAMAMAAVAMSVRLDDLKRLGWRPAAAALASALVLLAVAVTWMMTAAT